MKYTRSTRVKASVVLLLNVFAVFAFAQGERLGSPSSDELVANECKKESESKLVDLSEFDRVRFPYRFDNTTVSSRLHFKLGRWPANLDTKLTLRILINNSDEVAWETELTKESTEIWSDELNSNSVIVEVSTPAPNSGLTLTIDRRVQCRQPTIPKSSFPGSTFESIASPGINQQIKSAGRAIARLSIVSDEGLTRYCTGFLVSPDLLITNRHCVFSGTEANSITAWFDYDAPGASGVTRTGVKEIVAASCDLDFILLRVKASPCKSAGCNAIDDRKPISLKKSAAPSVGNALVVIQHPGGGPKQISRQGCSLIREAMVGNSYDLTDFGNRCNTAPMSSGSPVLLIGSDGNVGALVGIHHLGVRAEAVGAAVPESEKMNRAVYSLMIIQYLNRLKPAIVNELT